jgi:membrane protein implicated in regulation of membrane protease activity
MLWWHWVLLGLVLLGLEMLVPGGLFALFFGLAALVVGIIVAAGDGEPDWLPWLLFSLLSIVSLLLLRSPLLTRLKSHGRTRPRLDTLVGEVATLLEELPPGAVGKAELRGTVWNVQNGDTGNLHKGQRCRVERVDGLTLGVVAAGQKGEIA